MLFCGNGSEVKIEDHQPILLGPRKHQRIYAHQAHTQAWPDQVAWVAAMARLALLEAG